MLSKKHMVLKAIIKNPEGCKAAFGRRASFSRAILSGLLAASALLTTSTIVRGDTQTLTLASQWNLISFQVIPDNPDPQTLFATLPGFQSAWTYDTATGFWRRYIKPAASGAQQTNDSTANVLLALGPIEVGRAYWIFVNPAVPSWQVSGTAPRGPLFRSVNLNAGWNMIGIPVGAASVTNTEPVSLLAVLSAAGLDYDAMLAWENQSFRKMFRPPDTNSPLAGLPPDLPFPSFDLQKDLGRGYWLHVLDPAVLRPRLLATVRPDIDAEPTNNFPSKEDINVSGASAGARPKSVQVQDTIRFFAGEDVQTLSLSNVGDGTNGGGGIMLWEAVWIPSTDLGTPEPWIRLFASPAQRESRDQNGQLLAAYTNLTGVTTLENDIVYLRLDRKNLGRGHHDGTLLLRTSVGDKAYHVVAEVPGLEGDFKGYAVIQSVNGKRNPVPDIDLSVSLYEDHKVAGLLRGLIDSSQALLWPVDVPLIGYRVADAGNQFLVGGSFALPPGDQNGEPFDKWNENDPTAGADVDWLNDGVLDVRNPFPFPIQRTVSLQGSLIKGNPTDGYVLEGSYTEIVYGMSRQPLTLLGSFHLERQAARPLSTRRSVTSDTGVEPVISKKNSIPLTINAGATASSSLSIVTEMELRSLQVSLAFNSPLAHSSLLIKLQAPNASLVELVLYDGRSAPTAVNPKLLESVTFPLDRPVQGDLDQFLRAVPRTKTDSSLAQFWKLTISNAGAQAVTLANWTLRLEGQPVADVVGVVKNGATPISGVTVSLNGVPFSLYSGQSGSDGRFILSRVPLLPLNFSATLPGYLPADPSNPGLSTMFTRPFVGQQGLTFSPLEHQLISRFNALAGAPVALAGVPGFSSGTTNSPFELQLTPQPAGPPSIVAGPLMGSAGMSVDFYALNPAGSVTWDFDDGTTSSQPVTNHVFQTAGYYIVRLFSPSGGGSPQDTVGVLVMPAPGNAPARPADLGGEPTGLSPSVANTSYGAYIFQPFFTMAGAVPAHFVGIDPQTGADRYLSDITPQTTFAAGETNELGAAYVSMMPLQHAYAATMDIDLAPHITPANTSKLFDSDGFIPLSSPSFDSSINVNNQGFKNEDFHYSHLASLWQNTRAADGSLEYNQDAVNGLIVWGDTLISPNINFSVQTFQARDAAGFNLAQDSDTFHPHTGTDTFPDLAPYQVVTHYRMACSMGGTIVTVPTPPSAIKPAKPRRGEPDNPLDPELVAGPAPVSRNLYFQLHTGVLDIQ